MNKYNFVHASSHNKEAASAEFSTAIRKFSISSRQSFVFHCFINQSLRKTIKKNISKHAVSSR